MKKRRNFSNVHGGVRFKQKKKLTTAFTGNIIPHRKKSRKDAEDLNVDKIACHQHATLSKLNSPRYFNNS